MQLNNSDNATIRYYVRLGSGQEIGPYITREQAQTSAATMPIVEGFEPQIVPRTTQGQQFLLG